jgi:hypothetical protein
MISIARVSRRAASRRASRHGRRLRLSAVAGHNVSLGTVPTAAHFPPLSILSHMHMHWDHFPRHASCQLTLHTYLSVNIQHGGVALT